MPESGLVAPPLRIVSRAAPRPHRQTLCMIHTKLFSILKRTIVGSVCWCSSSWTFINLQPVQISGVTERRNDSACKKKKNTVVLTKDYGVVHNSKYWIPANVLHNLNIYLWWAYLFLMGVSVPPEPAAFSAKTTPQTENPKVTKPHLPPMSLTQQVTSTSISRLILLFFSSRYLLYLFFITYTCLLFIPSFSSCMHHCIWLPHLPLSVPLTFLFFLSLPLTHTNTIL